MPWQHNLAQLTLGKAFTPKHVTECHGLYFNVWSTGDQLSNILLEALSNLRDLEQSLDSMGKETLFKVAGITACMFVQKEVSFLCRHQNLGKNENLLPYL